MGMMGPFLIALCIGTVIGILAGLLLAKGLTTLLRHPHQKTKTI
jgi:gas vesicle protein